jgi:hypothetical protein
MNDYPTTLRVIAAYKAGEDLAERLGSAVKAQNAMADALKNAADYIERLQNELYLKNDEKHGVADTNRATLTDAEREAVEWCLSLPMLERDVARMMPLRSLLERLK